jgi:hypothetical protein
LPGAEVAHIVDPAREHEIKDRAASALQPRLQAPTGFSHDLELNRSASFLLNDSRAVANLISADKVANLEFDQITAAQFAVDRQIKQRAGACARRDRTEWPRCLAASEAALFQRFAQHSKGAARARRDQGPNVP